MEQHEQLDLLDMWNDFLEGRRPSGRLMREFYFDVVSHSRLYRYGMAAELFDLLINGTFRFDDRKPWAHWEDRNSDDPRAA